MGLIDAVCQGDVARVQTILDGGQHNPIVLAGALSWACVTGRAEIASLLVQHGADPRNTTLSYPPLICASAGGHTEAIRIILQAGENPNVKDVQGFTPLHRVYMSTTDGESVRLLIDAGADVRSTCTLQGSTPLHCAAQFERLQNVRTLLEAGAEPNAADELGNTPLYDVVKQDHLEIIRLLLRFGANPMAANRAERTPLDFAAERGCTEAVRLLVQSCEGRPRCETALRLACRGKHTETAQFLMGVHLWASDEPVPLVPIRDCGFRLEAITTRRLRDMLRGVYAPHGRKTSVTRGMELRFYTLCPGTYVSTSYASRSTCPPRYAQRGGGRSSNE